MNILCITIFLGILVSLTSIKITDRIIYSKINYKRENIPELLNRIITDNFNEYMVLNPKYLEELYINNEQQREIVEEVVSLILSRISKSLWYKLSLYYNEKALVDIITKNVYTAIVNFAVEKNKPSTP